MGRIVINTAIDNTGLEQGYSKAEAATSRFVSSVAKNIGGISNALNKVDIKSLSDALDEQNSKISAQKKIVADLEAEYKKLSDHERAQLESTAALYNEQAKVTRQISSQEKSLALVVQKQKELSYIATQSSGDWSNATNAQIKQNDRYITSIENIQDKIIELSKWQSEISEVLSGPPSMEAYKIAPQLESANEALMDMIFNAGRIGKELQDAQMEAERLYDAAKSAAVEITPTITEVPEAPVEVAPEVSPAALDEVAQDIQQAIEPEITPEITPEINTEEIQPAANRIEEIIEKNARPIIRPDIASMSMAELEKGLVKSQREAERLAKNIESVQAKVYAFQDRQQMGEVLTEAEYERFSAARAKLEDLGVAWQAATDSAAQYQARIEEVNSQPPDPKPISDFTDRFKAGASAVASFAKKSISTIGSITSKVGNGIKSAAGRVSGFMKRATKDTGGLTSAIEHTLRRIKQLLVSALVFNVLRSAFREFRDYIGQALNANQAFARSFAQVQANLKTAFQPILQYIIPALSTLMQTLAVGTQYLVRFMSALTGKSVKNLQDAAKNMDKLGKATKKTGKAADGTLAAFDQINQLQKESADIAAAEDVAVAPVYEEIPEFTWIDEFANKLKELVPDLDYFFDLGRNIGDKLTAGLASIPWDFIRAWGISFVQKFAALLNGLVSSNLIPQLGTSFGEAINTILTLAYAWFTSFDYSTLGARIALGLSNAINTINWKLLGSTLASYFMAAINFAYSFVTNFPWVQFGTSIGDAINSFFADMDWAKAGQTISNGILGALSAIGAAIQTIDWYQIGQDVRDFLVSIDWAQIIADLAYVLGQAIAGIGLFLWGVIEDAVKGIGDFWRDRFEDAGGNIIAGLFYGILVAIGNIAIWLYDNLVKPFVDGIKSLFGIHSPSTVMAEFGVNLIEGLIVGIKSLMDSAIKLFVAIWEGVKRAWSVSAKWFDDAVINPITGFFNNLWTTISGAAIFAWDTIKNAASAMFNALIDIARKPINAVIGFLNGMISGIVSGINAVIGMINAISFTIPDWVPGFGGNRIGFNIQPRIAPQIPKLATGTVVPASNGLFTAQFGDSKFPEVVAPTPTIEQAVENVLSRLGIVGGNQEFILEIDGQRLGRIIAPRIVQEGSRQGTRISVDRIVMA